MTCTQANQQININDYLLSQGFRPLSESRKFNLYRSPLRDDKNPSFATYPNNRWFDFGTQKGGTLVDFVKLLHGMTVPDVLKHLSEFSRKPQPFFVIKPKEIDSPLIDYTYSPIQHPALVTYLKARKLNAWICQNCEQLCQVTYEIERNGRKIQVYNIGFKNNSGGCELRGTADKFKHCIAPKDYTLIMGSGKEPFCVNIFESWSDYLSALTWFVKMKFNNDTIVLNSVSMLSKAMGIIGTYHRGTIYCFLDNDSAGIKAFERLAKHGNAVNCSAKYYPKFKDFNDFLLQIPLQKI